MKHLLLALLFNFGLFMLLTPGMVLTLPSPGSNKETISATHAAVFAAAQVLLAGLLKKYIA